MANLERQMGERLVMLAFLAPLIKFYHIFCSLGTLCVLWKQRKKQLYQI